VSEKDNLNTRAKGERENAHPFMWVQRVYVGERRRERESAREARRERERERERQCVKGRRQNKGVFFGIYSCDM